MKQVCVRGIEQAQALPETGRWVRVDEASSLRLGVEGGSAAVRNEIRQSSRLSLRLSPPDKEREPRGEQFRICFRIPG